MPFMETAGITYRDAVRTGFAIIHRNWQLVALQVAAMIASFFGFIVLVGFPLAVAFIIFGLDFTELVRTHGVAGFLYESPSGMLSRNIGLAILVLFGVLLYILAILCVKVFIFGGSIGFISAAVRKRADSFRARDFFAGGRRLFFPTIGLTTLVGLIFIVPFFILGLFGGATAFMVAIAKQYDATLALFLGSFFSLVLGLLLLALAVSMVAVTFYGAAAMTLRRLTVLGSARESILFLYHHPGAIPLLCLTFFGYIVLLFAVLSAGYLMSFVPFLGPLLSLLINIGAYAGESYLWLVMITALFTYYAAAHPEDAESSLLPDEGATDGASTQASDSDETQDQEPGDTPPQTGQPG